MYPAIGLGLVSCSVPVVLPDLEEEEAIPTYEEFLAGLDDSGSAGEVTDIFASGYLELVSPSDTVLATPVFEDCNTVLCDSLVLDSPLNMFDVAEAKYWKLADCPLMTPSFRDSPDVFCNTPCPRRWTFMNVLDITETVPRNGGNHVVTLIRSNAIKRPTRMQGNVTKLVRQNAIRRTHRGC